VSGVGDFSIFPVLNATLNGLSAVFILTGREFIRRKRMQGHAACMISAVACSVIFLCSYLYYHFNVGSVRFQGQGIVRPVYFAILLSHTILAVTLVPLVMVTLRRAVKKNFERHRAIARWTYPVWLYVSVTGVIIYLMLYHWFRA
jgi:uncharacterized membrane protein YozB (DUF420 family)